MNFDPIHYQFNTKQLAEKALEELQQICDENGFVTLAALERAVGCGEQTDDGYLYGWEDLDASIVYPIGPKFYIRAPRPSPISYFYIGGEHQ